MKSTTTVAVIHRYKKQNAKYLRINPISFPSLHTEATLLQNEEEETFRKRKEQSTPNIAEQACMHEESYNKRNILSYYILIITIPRK